MRQHGTFFCTVILARPLTPRGRLPASQLPKGKALEAHTVVTGLGQGDGQICGTKRYGHIAGRILLTCAGSKDAAEGTMQNEISGGYFV